MREDGISPLQVWERSVFVREEGVSPHDYEGEGFVTSGVWVRRVFNLFEYEIGGCVTLWVWGRRVINLCEYEVEGYITSWVWRRKVFNFCEYEVGGCVTSVIMRDTPPLSPACSPILHSCSSKQPGQCEDCTKRRTIEICTSSHNRGEIINRPGVAGAVLQTASSLITDPV